MYFFFIKFIFMEVFWYCIIWFIIFLIMDGVECDLYNVNFGLYFGGFFLILKI